MKDAAVSACVLLRLERIRPSTSGPRLVKSPFSAIEDEFLPQHRSVRTLMNLHFMRREEFDFGAHKSCRSLTNMRSNFQGTSAEVKSPIKSANSQPHLLEENDTIRYDDYDHDGNQEL
ncbi:hypothetical protein [Neorhizobium sp. T6_25]|uniref:hypothetical protein n=1 Tax=Neorhizobium sp. T6_25 TaxID=2093833 RepID=UPI00155EDB05|nr:hypothetical protein [Neorhizobium sp. T6_25]